MLIQEFFSRTSVQSLNVYRGLTGFVSNGEWNNILKEQIGPVRLKKREMSGTQLV